MAEDTLKVELVCRDFNRMLEELAAIDTRIEFRDVVIGAAATVVESALRGTKAATKSGIVRNFEGKEFTTFNGKRYKLSNRYPDALWGGISEFRRRDLAVKIAAMGLAKQSWLWTGAKLGPTINAPSFVQSASYKGRRYSEDGTGFETGSADGFAVTILNSSPIVQAAGGQRALFGAMKGVTMRFQKSMERRAFATVESRAKAFPKIFVT